MGIELSDFHKTRNLIHRYSKDHLDILRTYYDPATCSFARTSLEDLRNKQKTTGDNPKKRALWEQKSLGYKIEENLINLTSSTSCYHSLIQQYSDEYLKKKIDFDKEILKKKILINPWESAELYVDNPYTISMILPVLKELGADKTDPCIRSGLDTLKKQLRPVEKEEEAKTIDKIKKGRNLGGIFIWEYPQNAFLTYCALKSIEAFGEFDRDTFIYTREWAFGELTKHILYYNSKRTERFDVYQMIYSFLIIKHFFEDYYKDKFTQSSITYCLDILFQVQHEEGNWTSDKPLFHYPGEGNAYCHDFEMLIALLDDFDYKEDYEDLRKYLDNFKKTLTWIENHYKEQETLKTKGWCSYHNYKRFDPESWASAAVHFFPPKIFKIITQTNAS